MKKSIVLLSVLITVTYAAWGGSTDVNTNDPNVRGVVVPSLSTDRVYGSVCLAPSQPVSNPAMIPVSKDADGVSLLRNERANGTAGAYRYAVQVTDAANHTVHVTCNAWDISGTVTVHYLAVGVDPDGDIAPIQNFAATLNAVPVAVVETQFEYSRSFTLTLPEPATEAHPLVFQYDCVLHQIPSWCTELDQYEAYLDDMFGIIRANCLFIQPIEPDCQILAQFDLPLDWLAVTPWDEETGWYVLRDSGSINIDLGECVIGLGPFEVHQQQVGPTLVTAAMVGDLELLLTRERYRRVNGLPALPQSELPEFVFSLFDHYLDVVGGCPVSRYTVFFHPLTADGRWVNCSGWATGTASEYEAPPEWIAHEMFHWWNRVVPMYSTWLNEGWTWFFAWEGIVHVGVIDRSQWLDQRLVPYYELYVRELTLPEFCVPVTTPDHLLSPVQLNSLIARRELLGYGLDEALKAATGGISDLASVVALLYERFGPQPGQWRGDTFDNSNAEQAIADVGSAGALQFFQAHIDGTDAAFLPELLRAWLEPWTLQGGVASNVQLLVRPAEYLLTGRERAALVVRVYGNQLSREELAAMISPSLTVDVSIGDDEINEWWSTPGQTHEYDAEVILTVQVQESGDEWSADLDWLALRNVQYFIWDSTFGDFSGYLHPIAYFIDPDSDGDGDGISDGNEMRDLDPDTPGTQNPFDPLVPDSIGDDFQDTPDGKPDGWNDYDGDGMCNAHEFWFGTDPLDPDSWAEVPATTAFGLSALVLVLLADFLRGRHRRA